MKAVVTTTVNKKILQKLVILMQIEYVVDINCSWFGNYPTEYWHWSYGDRYWAYIKNYDCALYGNAVSPAMCYE